jgi:hypothetical protein
MIQERRHTCHLLPGGVAAVTRQPVVPSSLVVGGRPARDFFDQTVFEHLLDGAVQRAGAQFDFAVAAFGDVVEASG